MALASYNKYLRRHLNFEINDKLYPKIIQTYIMSENESINISKAFKADKLEPVKYLSSLVPGTPVFMKEKWGEKIRTWGNFRCNNNSYNYYTDPITITKVFYEIW